MMPEPPLLLAGFTLAHALGSIADVDELLCPLALIERNGERELLRFEAETQEEAISAGKEHLRANEMDADAWAFAREGVLDEGGEKVDVISVDLAATAMSNPITFVQRFEPFARRNQFRLIGAPLVIIGGVKQDHYVTGRLLPTLRQGIQEHGMVAPLWDTWEGW
jgi:hypothetical protein